MRPFNVFVPSVNTNYAAVGRASKRAPEAPGMQFGSQPSFSQSPLSLPALVSLFFPGGRDRRQPESLGKRLESAATSGQTAQSQRRRPRMRLMAERGGWIPSTPGCTTPPSPSHKHTTGINHGDAAARKAGVAPQMLRRNLEVQSEEDVQTLDSRLRFFFREFCSEAPPPEEAQVTCSNRPSKR